MHKAKIKHQDPQARISCGGEPDRNGIVVIDVKDLEAARAHGWSLIAVVEYDARGEAVPAAPAAPEMPQPQHGDAPAVTAEASSESDEPGVAQAPAATDDLLVDDAAASGSSAASGARRAGNARGGRR